jgi:hypothetical protein
VAHIVKTLHTCHHALPQLQMIGFLEPTSGQAFINGKDLSTDMNSIYQTMGVCPQDNLLWETLTAREHLNFYARLKGLNGTRMREAVDAVLQSVSLNDVSNKRTGKFSGGAFFPPALRCIVPWLHLSTQCAAFGCTCYPRRMPCRLRLQPRARPTLPAALTS